MGELQRKAFAEEQERIAVEREAMIQRNLKQIEEDENQPPPSPTVAEIQAAMGVKTEKLEEPEETKESEKETKESEEEKTTSNNVAKTSTAADQKGGQYKTRDMGRK